METVPSVSVVIPHHGDPQPTSDLISSLALQQEVTLQLIVVDDASPDAFPPVPGVEVVRRDVNGGFGSTVNIGAAQAEHDLLLILNSDVEVGPTFVADLVRAAAPWMPAVVSPRVVGTDGRSQWTGRHFPTATHQAVEWLTPLARFRHLRPLHELVGHDMSSEGASATPVDWVVGACMLMRTADFRSVGGFDERFYMNSEEVDLQRRLRQRGIPSVVLPEVTLVHEGGGSSPSLRRRQWLVDGRARYAAKWGGTTRLKLALSAATGINAVVNSARQVAGRDIDARAVARHEWDLIWGRRG